MHRHSQSSRTCNTMASHMRLSLLVAILVVWHRIEALNLDPRSAFDLDEFRLQKEVVPILRSVDRQNDDGSYTYGYESGDGSYRIETRLASGEVRGKYGYYDPDGKLREVQYGAAPHTGFVMNNENNGFDYTNNDNHALNNVYSDNNVYSNSKLFFEPVSKHENLFFDNHAVLNDALTRQRQLVLQQHQQQEQRVRQQQQQLLRQQEQLLRQQQLVEQQQLVDQRLVPGRQQGRRVVVRRRRPEKRPVSRPINSVSLINLDSNLFQGHPAANIDLNTGSYSFSYSG